MARSGAQKARTPVQFDDYFYAVGPAPYLFKTQAVAVRLCGRRTSDHKSVRRSASRTNVSAPGTNGRSEVARKNPAVCPFLMLCRAVVTRSTTIGGLARERPPALRGNTAIANDELRCLKPGGVFQGESPAPEAASTPPER